MGSHRKKSLIRKHLLPTAAVPALAGMAAAVCLAPQAQAQTAPAHAAVRTAVTAVTAERATVAGATSHAGLSAADLLAVVRQSSGQAQKAQADRYTIRSGDSLSKNAGKVYHKQNAWPVLYWANRDKIQWANIISTGQVLKVPALPAKIPAAPGQLAPAPPPPPPAPAPVAAASATSYAAPVQATSQVSGGTYSGGGGFQSCVIARESGGNSQVMNSSGHYGLYQFSASTWAAYGGSAASFGHASVAEQNQVFNNAIAQGGQSNWSPYDGC